MHHEGYIQSGVTMNNVTVQLQTSNVNHFDNSPFLIDMEEAILWCYEDFNDIVL